MSKTRINRHSAALVTSLESRQLLSSTITFAPHVDFTAGTLPVALVAADFNGDGNEDLAVADNSADRVSIFLGNGAGSFSAGPVLSLSSPPVAMITGDFNGDGKPDIAVACTAGIGQSTTSVVVFLNTGGGTFGLGQITTVEAGATPGEAVALAAGDFNADGHLDLAVTDYSSESISILIGNGTGIFAAPDNYQSDAHPLAITEADFNNDGYPDLAVTNTITDSSSGAAVTTNDVSLLLGSSTGDFSAGPNIQVDSGGLPTSITAGNFTGATTPGLVVGSSDASATVLTNTSGTFAPTAPVSVAAGSTAVAVGDFDLDGTTDFVSADGGSSTSTTTNSVTVVPGVGTGTDQFTTGGKPADVVVADFNNDGKPDIATANEIGGTVSILLNTTAIPLIKTSTTATVSSASTPAGSAVTLMGTISVSSVSPLTNEELPTGSVNFYDGSTLVATIPLASGATQAVESTSALTIGSHKLRAVYSGDDAYSGSSSTVVDETISPTATQGPDLIGAFVSSTLPAIVAPGETGVVKIRVTNQGNTIASGSITDAMYLSLDTTIDASDTLLTLRGSLARTNLHLEPNQSVVLTGTITIPQATSLASYHLLAALDSTGSLAESVSTNNTVVSPTTDAVSDVFGTVDGRKGIVLQVANTAGVTATFKLTGAGNGTVNIGDDGTDVTLDQTTAAGVLTVTTAKGAPFSIHDLTADSPVGSLKLSTTSITDSLTLPGGVTTVSLAGASTNAGGEIKIGGGTITSLSLGTLNNAVLITTGGIRLLSFKQWTGGGILSPWITTIRAKANLLANVSISGVGAPGGFALRTVIAGGTIGPASSPYPPSPDGFWNVSGAIGQLTAATFSSYLILNVSGLLKSLVLTNGMGGSIGADAVGSISVRGNVSNVNITSGKTIGSFTVYGNVESSAIYGGGYQAGSIGTIRVTGMVYGTTFTTSINEATRAVLAGGLIDAIDIGGIVDPTSKFQAGTLPKKAILDGVVVDPMTDPHFQG